jgi:hypothetical protein
VSSKLAKRDSAVGSEMNYFKKYLFQWFKFSDWFTLGRVDYDIPDFIRAARIAVEQEKLKNRLTKWILLAGPVYENSRYNFPVLIETKKLLVWAISFGKSINLRNQKQLYLVRGLADKVTNANNDDEAVTLLDESLREIREFERNTRVLYPQFASTKLFNSILSSLQKTRS